MTQLSLYGRAAKISVTETRLEQEMRFYTKGSMKEGTIENGCLGMETHLHLSSDESPDRIRELVRMGDRMCYTLQSLSEDLLLSTRVSLNGEELSLDSSREDR